jgi:DNA-binding Xre family transcriptional regulator
VQRKRLDVQIGRTIKKNNAQRVSFDVSCADVSYFSALFIGESNYMDDRIKVMFLTTMKDLGINKTELAKRLGVNRARVTQMFTTDTNWSISTIEKVAEALGCEIHLQIKPK